MRYKLNGYYKRMHLAGKMTFATAACEQMKERRTKREKREQFLIEAMFVAGIVIIALLDLLN